MITKDNFKRPQLLMLDDMAKPTDRTAILLDWIRTEFNLPDVMAAECQQFFLRVWEPKYFFDCCHDGVFNSGVNGTWIIHFQSTPEVCKNAERLGCSFREYQGKKYVVVNVWKDKRNSTV